MSDLPNPNPPGEALFKGGYGPWGENTTFYDPVDGPVDFEFDLPPVSNVDLFGHTTAEGGWADVHITDQTTPERTHTSPVSEPRSSDDNLFGEKNEGAQAGVQTPPKSISKWANSSTGTYNSSQAEQAQETVVGSTSETSSSQVQTPPVLDAGEQVTNQPQAVQNTVSIPVDATGFQLATQPGSFSEKPYLQNQPSRLTSMGSQGATPTLAMLLPSTTPQPQTVPDLSQGYWGSLLDGNANTADPMGLGSTEALGGLAADFSSGAELDLQNSVEVPDPYPWGPLQENYRGLDLPSKTATGSSFIGQAKFASSGIQQSARHTVLNSGVPTLATHQNLALSGGAVWGTRKVDCGNPINPGMTTVPWTRQAAVSAAPNPENPIQAPGPAFAPAGATVPRASTLDPSLIDPDIVKEPKDKHGPMDLGGLAAPQPTSALTPAVSGTMPDLKAPMMPSAVPTRPNPERILAQIQLERLSRPIREVQPPAQEIVRPISTSDSGVAARDDIGPKKRMVLVHQRGTMDVRPSDVYRPLKTTPEAWGPPMFKDLFKYTEHGEWHPSLRFAHKDLMFYIINARAYAKRPLKIWIQHCPSQRNYRYPNPHSSRCRWDECPANNNTILKGFYRVAFDEWSDLSGKVTDPFHNAGYMHLHCFEKMFDLFELIKYGFAELETRNFLYEDQNPMSVVEGHPQLTGTFRNWCYDHAAAYQKFQQEKSRGGPQFRRIPKKQRLWFVLTDRYVELESVGRMRIRAMRNGNSLDKHLGDLDSFVHAVKKRRALAKQARMRALEEFECDEPEPEEHDARVKRACLGKVRAKKRVVVELDSDDSELEEEIIGVKRAPGDSSAARGRAAEAVDDGESPPDEDSPRVKPPPSSGRQVRSPSPARSHITVEDSNEEEVEPASEDPSHSSDDGEFEFEDGYPVHETQAPAENSLPAERLSPRTETPRRQKMSGGEHEDTQQSKRAWDADLRQEQRPTCA